MYLARDWYRGLEPVLALHPSFSTDHVTAYRTLKNNHYKLIPERNQSITKPPKEDFLMGGGGGGGGPMTTFGDLGNYVNDFTPSPHDF